MPKKKIPVGMDFPSAMERIIEGKRVTRIPWPKSEYSLLQDSFLRIYKKTSLAARQRIKWNPTAEDVMANDWIIHES